MTNQAKSILRQQQLQHSTTVPRPAATLVARAESEQRKAAEGERAASEARKRAVSEQRKAAEKAEQDRAASEQRKREREVQRRVLSEQRKLAEQAARDRAASGAEEERKRSSEACAFREKKKDEAERKRMVSEARRKAEAERDASAEQQRAEVETAPARSRQSIYSRANVPAPLVAARVLPPPPKRQAVESNESDVSRTPQPRIASSSLRLPLGDITLSREQVGNLYRGMLGLQQRSHEMAATIREVQTQMSLPRNAVTRMGPQVYDVTTFRGPFRDV